MLQVLQQVFSLSIPNFRKERKSLWRDIETIKTDKNHSNWPYTSSHSHTSHLNNGTKPYTQTQAVVLGLGSMFNHSNIHQNIGWERDIAAKTITYTSLRDIKEGEELCISYGQRLTFKDTEEELYQSREGGDDWGEFMNIIGLID